ncbi:MAG: dockerin type I domain-containing protein, partial [Patescibacteria group bacterium]
GGGGGGGGVASTNTNTNVTFSGRAYPGRTVTFLKDGQVSGTTIADARASFQISASGLSGGNYVFSVYSEDNKGIRSSLVTFPVSVTTGLTTRVDNIFIAPTIAVDKSEVKRGDNIAIFGQTAPQADILIQVNSEEEFFTKTISDKDGIYLYNFNTAFVEYGSHLAKSKSSIGNLEISGFSSAIGFTVGTKNIIAKLPQKSVPSADLSGDKKVNLIDFSILAYWYKRSSPPLTHDLNKDGKVDLVDLSIMAYNWTG